MISRHIVSLIGRAAVSFILFFSMRNPCKQKIRLSHSALESSNSVWYWRKSAGSTRKMVSTPSCFSFRARPLAYPALVAGDVQWPMLLAAA